LCSFWEVKVSLRRLYIRPGFRSCEVGWIGGSAFRKASESVHKSWFSLRSCIRVYSSVEGRGSAMPIGQRRSGAATPQRPNRTAASHLAHGFEARAPHQRSSSRHTRNSASNVRVGAVREMQGGSVDDASFAHLGRSDKYV
jgi:hypothetical protein